MRPQHFVRLLPITAIALLSACGGDGGGGGVAPDPLDAIQSVTVAPATERVPIGGSLQLSATVRNGRGETVTGALTWTSSNVAVATVDGTGRVVGVAPGAVTITASTSGRSGTAAIESFDPLWESLPPAHKEKLIHLLIERVEYDGADESISLTFHPTGIRTLTQQHQEADA